MCRIITHLCVSLAAYLVLPYDRATLATAEDAPRQETANVRFLVDDKVPRRLGVFPPNSTALAQLIIPNQQGCDLEVVGTSKSCGCSKISIQDKIVTTDGSLVVAVEIANGAEEAKRTVQITVGLRAKDSKSNERHVDYVANLLLQLQVRNPVSWQPRPLRLTLPGNRSVSVNAINFSPYKWKAVLAKCDDPLIELQPKLQSLDFDEVARDAAVIDIVNKSNEDKKFSKQIRLELFATYDEERIAWVKVDSVPLLINQEDLFTISPSRVYLTNREWYRFLVASDFPEFSMADAVLSAYADDIPLKVASQRAISERLVSLEIPRSEVEREERDEITIRVSTGAEEWNISIPIHKR